MKVGSRAALVAIWLGTTFAVPAAARQVDSGLEQIESLIAADRLEDARAALDEWVRANPAALSHDRAAAGILRGRLARSWNEAEQALLATALGYPASGDAAQALLRLGQGLLTAARTRAEPDAGRRAVAYLERLVADYPNTPLRAQAFLWLARALHAQGRTAAACSRLEQAPAAPDATTAALIEAERQLRCTAPSNPRDPHH